MRRWRRRDGSWNGLEGYSCIERGEKPDWLTDDLVDDSLLGVAEWPQKPPLFVYADRVVASGPEPVEIVYRDVASLGRLDKSNPREGVVCEMISGEKVVLPVPGPPAQAARVQHYLLQVLTALATKPAV